MGGVVPAAAHQAVYWIAAVADSLVCHRDCSLQLLCTWHSQQNPLLHHMGKVPTYVSVSIDLVIKIITSKGRRGGVFERKCFWQKVGQILMFDWPNLSDRNSPFQQFVAATLSW